MVVVRKMYLKNFLQEINFLIPLTFLMLIITILIKQECNLEQQCINCGMKGNSCGFVSYLYSGREYE